MQSSDAGKFVCTVEFDRGLSLTAETTLKVNTSGKIKLLCTTLKSQLCRDAHLSEPYQLLVIVRDQSIITYILIMDI